jgi:hypothetical protein
MSFGGGGSGAAAITAHIHSTAAGEGGALRAENSITTGTAIRLGAQDRPIEVLL